MATEGHHPQPAHYEFLGLFAAFLFCRIHLPTVCVAAFLTLPIPISCSHCPSTPLGATDSPPTSCKFFFQQGPAYA